MNSGENQETDYNRSNRSEIGLFRVFNPQGQSKDNFIGKMRIFFIEIGFFIKSAYRKKTIFSYEQQLHIDPDTLTP